MTVARLSWAVAIVVFLAAAPRPLAAQTIGQAPPTGVEPESTGSPWGWVKLPKVTMPKIQMPKMPADPLAPFKTSARKVSDGTKKAWEGTKELFTFGGKKDPAVHTASATEAPSMWQRMFGGAEEERPPQSVAEWMNQPRPEE